MAKIVACQVSAFIKSNAQKCKINKQGRSNHTELKLPTRRKSYKFVILGGKLYGISPLILLELTSLIERTIKDRISIQYICMYNVYKDICACMFELFLKCTYSSFKLWRVESWKPRYPVRFRLGILLHS